MQEKCEKLTVFTYSVSGVCRYFTAKVKHARTYNLESVDEFQRCVISHEITLVQSDVALLKSVNSEVEGRRRPIVEKVVFIVVLVIRVDTGTVVYDDRCAGVLWVEVPLSVAYSRRRRRGGAWRSTAEYHR